MTTKATDWVWNKVVEPADDKVAKFQFGLVEKIGFPVNPAIDKTEKPFTWSRDRIADANHAARDGIRSVRSKLPHPLVHAGEARNRENRAARFSGIFVETGALALTRGTGNTACFASHVGRVGVKCAAYALVGTPQAALWTGFGAAWLATVAVPFTVVGLVGRAPLYVAGLAATAVLETPPLMLRTAGLTWRAITSAWDWAWNGTPEAQARRREAKEAREAKKGAETKTLEKAPEVEVKGKKTSHLRRSGTESRDASGRSFLGALGRKASQAPTAEAPKAPERGGLGE